MRNKVIMSILSVVLIAGLVLVGCAKPATPEVETPPEEEAPVEVEVIEWRFHSPHTEKRTEYALQLDWANMISEATDGRLKVTIYPGGALGFKDADMLRVVGKEATIESFLACPNYVTRDEPALSVLMPHGCGVFVSREEVQKMMPVAIEQGEKLYAEWGIRLLNWYPTPACYTGITAVEPLNSLEAMKGKKIRCYDVIQASAFRSLDVAAEVYPQADIYLNMKTGVSDAAVGYPTMVKNLSLQDVANYYSLFTVNTVPTGPAVNEEVFQALPADLQEIVLRVSKEHQEKYIKSCIDCSQDEADLAWIENETSVIILPEFSEEDKAVFSAAAFAAWKAKAEEYGPKAVEVQRIMQAELERIRAG